AVTARHCARGSAGGREAEAPGEEAGEARRGSVPGGPGGGPPMSAVRWLALLVGLGSASAVAADPFPGAPAVLASLEAPRAGMACIPGGPFLRGVNGGPHAPARPQQEVWVQTFYMDTHEVTYSAYKACEAEGRCRKAGPNYRDFDHPQQPINGVSWYDAKTF